MSPSSSRTCRFLNAFLLMLGFNLVRSVPVWDGLNGRDSIGLLVPGATYIEALGPSTYAESYTRHLTTYTPGELGNLTAIPNTRAPALFFINRNQLWHYINDTAIYPVNVHNITNEERPHPPLQLILGKKQGGINDGSWRWRGSMLYYDLPEGRGNQGLYFSCTTGSGLPGMFIFPIPSETPPGCDPLTLHSFSRQVQVEGKR